MENLNIYLYPGGYLLRVIRFLLGRKKLPLFDKKIKTNKIIASGNIQFVKINNNINNITIEQLFHSLKKYERYISVYVHGSWGDDTNNSFSDIDDFIIVDDKKLKGKKLKSAFSVLNKTDMKMCRIDPLQHHGHWIIKKSDLLNYDNSYIPSFVIKKSKRVFGDDKFSVIIDSNTTKKGTKRVLSLTINSIESNGVLYLENKLNYYTFKAFISSISLIPPLIFQNQGVNISKKDAINRANELFSKEEIKLINWATEVRANWKRLENKKAFHFFKLFSYIFINPFIWRIFAFKYSPQIKTNKIKKITKIEINKQTILLFLNRCKSYARK